MGWIISGVERKGRDRTNGHESKAGRKEKSEGPAGNRAGRHTSYGPMRILPGRGQGSLASSVSPFILSCLPW